MSNALIVNRIWSFIVISALFFFFFLIVARQALCIYGAQAKATAGAVTETHGGWFVLEPIPADVHERIPEDPLEIMMRAGWAHSEASLYSGRISGFAYSDSYTTDHQYRQYTYVNTFIKDTLEFNIPAGDYPEGLEVSLYGRLKGLLSSNSLSDDPHLNYSLPDASINYQSYIGSPPQVPLGIFEFSFWNTTYNYVDERYILRLTLVEPGDSVPADRTDFKDVHQSITLQVNNRTAFNPSWVGANFSALWVKLDVPPEVTWDSESGVLFNPISLPGDFFDDDVDGVDLAEFAEFYAAETYPEADLNEDRIINFADVTTFAENYGRVL